MIAVPFQTPVPIVPSVVIVSMPGFWLVVKVFVVIVSIFKSEVVSFLVAGFVIISMAGFTVDLEVSVVPVP